MTVSQLARVLPLARKQSVCVCVRLVLAARFQNVATLLAEQRGKVICWVHGTFERSGWNASMQALLSTSAASGPVTLAAACAWDLCTELHSIITCWSCKMSCCMTMLFFWLGNNLERRKHEESSQFPSVLSMCIFLKFFSSSSDHSLSLSFSVSFSLCLSHTPMHARMHTQTHDHRFTHIAWFSYSQKVFLWLSKTAYWPPENTDIGS